MSDKKQQSNTPNPVGGDDIYLGVDPGSTESTSVVVVDNRASTELCDLPLKYIPVGKFEGFDYDRFKGHPRSQIKSLGDHVLIGADTTLFRKPVKTFKKLKAPDE